MTQERAGGQTLRANESPTPKSTNYTFHFLGRKISNISQNCSLRSCSSCRCQVLFMRFSFLFSSPHSHFFSTFLISSASGHLELTFLDTNHLVTPCSAFQAAQQPNLYQHSPLGFRDLLPKYSPSPAPSLGLSGFIISEA